MLPDRIIKSPVIVDKNGKPSFPDTKRIPSEKWLQDFLPLCPDILPVADIDSNFSDLMYLCSEAAIKTSKKGKGRVDVIYISKSGRLVLVETKLHRNPESSREVLGQILDYAANIRASGWDYSVINDLYGKSDLYKDMCNKFKDLPDRETFIENVNRYIRQADFLMVIVGDTISDTVENLVAFVDSPIDMKYKLALCEIKTYKMGDKYLVVPRLTLNTKIIERAVITLQSDNIVCSAKNAPEPQKDSKHISIENFVNEFLKHHKNISEDVVYDFLNDLNRIEYSISAGSKHITFGIKNVISLFEISEKDIFFIPSRIQRRLKDPSNAKFQYFMAAMKPYVISKNEKLNEFYKINLKVMTSAKKSFLETLKKLKDVLNG